MRLTIIVAAVFVLNVDPTLGYVYSTQSKCTTLLGPKSVTPKTSSYVLTIPITFTKKTTITPTSTITPPPVTTTSTATAITTSTVFTTPTSTITETDTETDTSTSTNTVYTTETDAATTTTTPAAVVVGTAAGFTPLASEGSYSPKKRSESHVEAAVPAIRGRIVQERAAAQKSLNHCPPVGSPGKFSPAQYPTSVVCGALVEQITTTTKTYTASTIKTTTIAPVTNTVTTTTTNTVVSTSTPTTMSITSTTTTTISTSTTTTTTQTSTTTATTTVVAPTPTTYAACASNNVVGSANGNFGIYGVNYAAYNGVQLSQVATTDPVTCCASCQTAVNCVGFAQYPGGPCYLFTNPGQCNGAASFDDNFQTNAGVSAGQGYVVGNGNCGQLADGGSV